MWVPEQGPDITQRGWHGGPPGVTLGTAEPKPQVHGADSLAQHLG